jgi:hypothetical protein
MDTTTYRGEVLAYHGTVVMRHINASIKLGFPELSESALKDLGLSCASNNADREA